MQRLKFILLHSTFILKYKWKVSEVIGFRENNRESSSRSKEKADDSAFTSESRQYHQGFIMSRINEVTFLSLDGTGLFV